MPVLAAAALAVLPFVLVFTACDVEPAGGAVSITPKSVHLSKWQSQEFVASGGFDYSWTLKDESIGTLSARTGVRVTYTSSTSSSNWTQTLTVTSTIKGASGSTNATSSYQGIDTAYIYPKEYVASTVTAVTISPATLTMIKGESRTLEASGGDGKSYSWTLANANIGTLSSDSGEQVTYMSKTNGLQTVYAESGGHTGSATITQN